MALLPRMLMPKKIESILLPLVQRGVRELPYRFPEGLSVVISRVRTDSPRVRVVTVYMTAHFLPCPRGHCCGEPGCYSRFFWPEAREAMGRYLRRKLRLEHAVEVKFETELDYDPRIEWRALRGA